VQTLHARYGTTHTDGKGPEAHAGQMSGRGVLCAAVATGVPEVWRIGWWFVLSGVALHYHKENRQAVMVDRLAVMSVCEELSLVVVLV